MMKTEKDAGNIKAWHIVTGRTKMMTERRVGWTG